MAFLPWLFCTVGNRRVNVQFDRFCWLNTVMALSLVSSSRYNQGNYSLGGKRRYKLNLNRRVPLPLLWYLNIAFYEKMKKK